MLRVLGVQTFAHVGEKLDVPAVVTGKSDGAHVFLNRRADDLGRRPMVAKVNDLDAVADEFEVDRVDGAIVAIADRYGGQQPQGGRSHANANG